MRSNSDGFGIGWRAGDEILYKKFGPEGAEAFRELLKQVDGSEVEYVAHFRLRTHGPKDADNAHPYIYEDKKEGPILVFHNGVIPISTDNAKSDTATFVEQVLSEMPARWWANPAMKWLVQGAIGYSRIAIMTLNDTVRLTGGQKWIEQGGIYYS